MKHPTRRTVIQGSTAAVVATSGLGAAWQAAAGGGVPKRALQPLSTVLTTHDQHWVGDGFHVYTIFSPHRLDPRLLSPFILMDYAPPLWFDSSSRPRGVGEHPHRGFETVTFALDGEIDHRDSNGGGGRIGRGDVQWMTAGAGVVHEEMHSKRLTNEGGLLEMVQLWVNLPARLKMTPPRYQSLLAADFPRIEIRDASARVIAGEWGGVVGTARTHTPITILDIELGAGGGTWLEPKPGTTTLAFVLRGRVMAQGRSDLGVRDLVVFDRAKPGRLEFEARADTRLLVLNGEPFDEEVVARGPFVMNTEHEIAEAIRDYRSGKMGHL
ncbi:MAG: pirin family protein [Nannocystaceae bacterium]